jgi:hypothetical protein
VRHDAAVGQRRDDEAPVEPHVLVPGVERARALPHDDDSVKSIAILNPTVLRTYSDTISPL